MLSLRSARCLCRAQAGPIGRRSAHAAAALSSDDGAGASNNEAGPSDYYPRSRPSLNTNGNGKGKEKAKERDEYRYPLKGSRGGSPDPFEVMDLDRSASQADVKKQYYRLALLLHPDSSHPSSSPEHFASLHKAYTLLSSPQKRSSYVQTGYGWDGTSSGSGSGDEGGFGTYEERMRAEIRYRASAGTSSWHHRGGRPSYGDSDAGRGAWGGFRGGDGKWEPYDTGEFGVHQGTGEERYMSNTQFMGLIFAISIALGWAQYHRFILAKDQGNELLQKQHLDASHALAEARKEAAMFGKERRERIRRRVRESEVLREVEQLKLGQGQGQGSAQEQKQIE